LGRTSADTQREIEEIRKDVSSAFAELEARVGRATDFRAHARRASGSPKTLAGLALAGGATAALVVARVVSRARKSRRPEERLKRALSGAADELGERFERAREAIPLEMRFSSSGDDDRRGSPIELQGSEPSMLKKLLWAALAATMMAGAGLLARRISAAVWKAAMQEEPPTAKV
jgi:hypothetical protein